MKNKKTLSELGVEIGSELEPITFIKLITKSGTPVGIHTILSPNSFLELWEKSGNTIKFLAKKDCYAFIKKNRIETFAVGLLGDSYIVE
jgi:hypothetical protein